MSQQPSIYLYGRRPVLEALRRREGVQKVYLLYGIRDEQEFRARARSVGVPCTVVDRERFTELARAAGVAVRETQGVLALLSPVPVRSLAEVLEAIPAGEEGLLVALDGIEDPQNLGAIARSAEAAGAHGLLLPRCHSAPLTPATLKAAAGALLHLPVAHVPNLGAALRRLQEQGWWIIGTAPDGEHLCWEPFADCSLVLVIGSEHRGMRPSIRALCDRVVRIPLFGKIASLNASAAAAVLLFEIRRQRQQSLSTVQVCCDVSA
ncbi:Putative TrmH family tRNA/rRNA methyltransferase [bacterium HR21]|jgi:23S rRNA (guanosine2251-2'-O)-methyltransferase|nr:Putative TrmH family tRNA/rRNA methyltransferase [bacterium HR21]